jgi:uncharacterized membrane-anchored protein
MRALSRLLLLMLGLAVAGLAVPPAARAEPMTEAQRQAEASAALEAAQRAGTRGPAQVTLLDQGKLQVPAGMLFVPRAEAARLMRALGNTVGSDFAALVIDARNPSWVVVISYTKEGYVRDDDAADLKADDVLTNLREGTEEANKDRVARGFTPIDIIGWVQPPTYDKATHRLVWALSIKDKGEPDTADKGVNYNTRVLGRDGYFSLNLLTSLNRIDADKPVITALLGGLSYDSGKAYTDFTASTDRVAEYGLAALIGVVALKKIGLIALAGAFFLKFAKVIVLAVVGAGFVIKRLFRRKPPTVA